MVAVMLFDLSADGLHRFSDVPSPPVGRFLNNDNGMLIVTGDDGVDGLLNEGLAVVHCDLSA